MDVLKLSVIDAFYFSVKAPCGLSWQGMRGSDDVRIIVDRAMRHPGACRDCVKIRRDAERPL